MRLEAKLYSPLCVVCVQVNLTYSEVLVDMDMICVTGNLVRGLLSHRYNHSRVTRDVCVFAVRQPSRHSSPSPAQPPD